MRRKRHKELSSKRIIYMTLAGIVFLLGVSPGTATANSVRMKRAASVYIGPLETAATINSNLAQIRRGTDPNSLGLQEASEPPSQKTPAAQEWNDSIKSQAATYGKNGQSLPRPLGAYPGTPPKRFGSSKGLEPQGVSVPPLSNQITVQECAAQLTCKQRLTGRSTLTRQGATLR